MKKYKRLQRLQMFSVTKVFGLGNINNYCYNELISLSFLCNALGNNDNDTLG